MIGRLLLVGVICGVCCCAESRVGLQTYRGASDASAAVAVGSEMFVVADDENNILRVYRTSGGDRPVYSCDLSEFLEIDPEHPEADIEGATRVGERIYWITSHGRNKDGKLRLNRYRFFATDIEREGDVVRLWPVGKPCTSLVRALVSDKVTQGLGLYEATRLGADLSKKQREKLAPKEEGLNIEGLCASADGKTMYIGFRNPLVEDKASGRIRALVVPLLNAELVIKQGDRPEFGEPILWDYDGLGIRSMEYSAFHKAYFIIAGSINSTRKFRLYRWSGEGGDTPLLVKELSVSNMTPEALVPFEDSGELLLLSDDGTLPVKIAGPHECIDEDEYDSKSGTCENKYLRDPNKKTFRAIWLRP